MPPPTVAPTIAGNGDILQHHGATKVVADADARRLALFPVTVALLNITVPELKIPPPWLLPFSSVRSAMLAVTPELMVKALIAAWLPLIAVPTPVIVTLWPSDNVLFSVIVAVLRLLANVIVSPPR